MMCDVPSMAVFVGNLLSVVLVLFPDIFVNFCLQIRWPQWLLVWQSISCSTFTEFLYLDFYTLLLLLLLLSLTTGFLSSLVLLLLSQWWTPPLRLQVSACSTFLMMMRDIIIIIVVVVALHVSPTC
jgi:hypothetical protein